VDVWRGGGDTWKGFDVGMIVVHERVRVLQEESIRVHHMDPNAHLEDPDDDLHSRHPYLGDVGVSGELLLEVERREPECLAEVMHLLVEGDHEVVVHVVVVGQDEPVEEHRLVGRVGGQQDHLFRPGGRFRCLQFHQFRESKPFPLRR